MSQTDRTHLKNVQIGHCLSNSLTDAPGTVGKMHTHKLSCLVADAATAGTAVTETVIGSAVDAGKVTYINITAPIAVTGHATNNATITVSKRTAAGSAVIIGTYTTTLVSPVNTMVAFVPRPVTLATTAGYTSLAAGDVVTVLISKGSSGVALTAATSYFNVEVGVEYV